MQLSFNPPLGHTKTVAVSAGQDTITLVFKAKFHSHEEYVRAKRDGLKIEVWSDIQVGNQAPGEWSSLAFTDLDDPNSAEDAHREPSRTQLSLLRPGSESSRDDKRRSIQLKLQAHVHTRSRFSYTYRVIYPSGEIKWLGDFGRNGSLIVERKDPRLTLHDGWSQRENGSYVWEPYDHVKEVVEAARLSDEFAWSSWAVGQNGKLSSFSGSNPPTQASLVLLLPRPRADAIALYPPIIIATSPGSSLSISPSKIVQLHTAVSGSARLELCDALPNFQETLEELFKFSSTNLRILDCNGPSSHIVLASPERDPSIITVIRLNSSSKVSNVTLRVPALKECVTRGSRVVLFSFASNELRIVPDTTGESPDELISLTANEIGGQFVVSAIETLDHGDEKCDISLLSPYSVLPSEPELVNRLPTPPPSPIRLPVQSFPSVASQAETLLSQSVSAPEQGQRQAPEPHADVADHEEQGRVAETTPGEGEVADHRATAVSVPPSSANAQIKRYMFLFLHMTTCFFKSFFCRLFSFRSPGKPVEGRVEAEERVEEPSNTGAASGKPDPEREFTRPDSKGGSPVEAIAAERTLVQPSSSYDSASAEPAVESVGEEAPVNEDISKSRPLLFGMPGVGGSEREGKSNGVSLLAWCQSVSQLRIEFNGTPVKPTSERSLGDPSPLLVELPREVEGGRLSIVFQY